MWATTTGGREAFPAAAWMVKPMRHAICRVAGTRRTSRPESGAIEVVAQTENYGLLAKFQHGAEPLFYQVQYDR